MLSRISRVFPRLGRQWTPISFSNTNFIRVPEQHKIEEETLPGYIPSQYYPTQIGQVIKERYQVIGKVGSGSTSTVWLARDMPHRRYVMLKIFIQASAMEDQVDHELNMYRIVEQSPASNHPGRKALRTLLDAFYIDGPADRHSCLVHRPLWDSVLAFLRRNPVEKLPSVVVAVVLHRLFLALDYLHTECHIAHTDIKADNMMFEFHDQSILADFQQHELDNPVPRKKVDGRTIYTSQKLKMPSDISAPVLCDFGSAVHGQGPHTFFIQPNIYRSPEVILGVPWTFSADIWNAGCMVWDIYEGGSLFDGYDAESDKYRSRSHLAQMIDLLGPPPAELVAKGELRDKFFSSQGEFFHPELLSGPACLEQREETLKGTSEREAFLRLMRKMLQWDPEKRSSAKELAGDEWIRSYVKKSRL